MNKASWSEFRFSTLTFDVVANKIRQDGVSDEASWGIVIDKENESDANHLGGSG